MKTKTFITRAYVQGEDKQEYTLEYYITDDEISSETCNHGIEIFMFHKDICKSASANFPGNRDYILNLIEVYARNFVMPISLHDLIADL